MNSLTQTENQALTRRVLELDVNNHAGVMSHVVGLFSRRAYNVEGILVMPVGSGETSRIWLLVNEDERLDQMVKQIEKLEDVLAVRRHGAAHEVFVRLEEFFLYDRSPPPRLLSRQRARRGASVADATFMAGQDARRAPGNLESCPPGA
jgi:acetolactate synthase-1/3 small subunit